MAVITGLILKAVVRYQLGTEVTAYHNLLLLTVDVTCSTVVVATVPKP